MLMKYFQIKLIINTQVWMFFCEMLPHNSYIKISVQVFVRLAGVMGFFLEKRGYVVINTLYDMTWFSVPWSIFPLLRPLMTCLKRVVYTVF